MKTRAPLSAWFLLVVMLGLTVASLFMDQTPDPTKTGKTFSQIMTDAPVRKVQ